ncbi:hypothetical protein [Dendrosporobacter sp. 1207_IL3150]|uniref:hypothetical protein n=1 Tax=Dendrosporobacter sp. 1207_IL3150 TaxID=3084054 RepID=UPI002FD9402A
MLTSIKFCGGCNPRIDRRRLAKEIEDYLNAHGVRVVYNSTEADFIICISGCTASCARQGIEYDKPAALIAGESVDDLAVGEKSLSSIVINKVRDYLGKLEKPL